MSSASSAWRGSRREDKTLIRRLLYVAFFLEVGLLLIVLPWSALWEQNYFVGQWPALGRLLRSDYARGAVSGLGVVNVVAGVVDLVPLFAARGRRDVRGARDLP
ncbi:MAG: hypothetical protein IT176_02635 [Acidobacteria bacterium]|nr:hypothetical protein [Acidobacteriota bacterium]